MNADVSATRSPGARSVSPLRLRAGVLAILLWWAPIWLLAPHIADSLSGLDPPPSVALVTTIIVVVQTLIGVIGIVVAGSAVRAIVKGSTKREALRLIWQIFLHGEIQGPTDVEGEPKSQAPRPHGT
jgi:hypothetical protein